MAGHWKFDPCAYFYIGEVDTFLRAPGRAGVALDLFDRLQSVLAKTKEGDNSQETTKRRISWCCHVVGDMLIEQMEAPPVPTPPELRPVMTETMLNAMDRAFEDVEQAANVNKAEYQMVDDEARRNAQQLWEAKVDKLKRLLVPAKRVLLCGRYYFNNLVPGTFHGGAQEAAAEVGDAFFDFLTVLDKSRDDLVKIAESLVEVHA